MLASISLTISATNWNKEISMAPDKESDLAERFDLTSTSKTYVFNLLAS